MDVTGQLDQASDEGRQDGDQQANEAGSPQNPEEQNVSVDDPPVQARSPASSDRPDVKETDRPVSCTITFQQQSVSLAAGC